MAKAIQYVLELSAEDAEVFLKDILNPKPNLARDAMIEFAKHTNFEIRRGSNIEKDSGFKH